MRHLKFRLGLSLGLISAFALGAAVAGEVGSHKTKLKFKDGETVETISFEGALTMGQSVGLYSEAGTPVTVTRTEEGLKVDLPNKTHVVPYHESGDEGGGERKVVIVKHEGMAGELGELKELALECRGSGECSEKTVIVHKHHGELAEGELADMIDSDPELAAAIEAARIEGSDGKIEKIIIKRHEHAHEVHEDKGEAAK